MSNHNVVHLELMKYCISVVIENKLKILINE